MVADIICEYCILEMCFLCDQPVYDEKDESAEPECCCEGTYGRVTLFAPASTGGPTKEPKDYSGLPKRMVPANRRGETQDRLNGKPWETDPDKMLNPVAVGRARALDVAPIVEDYECEWSMLEFAGGGIVPIVGCTGNLAADRHHGPDKSTLNNAVGTNLHRICEECHNRWHQLNDEYYPERPANNGVGYFPLSEYGECREHDRSTRASALTITRHSEWWRQSRDTRPAYRQWRPVGSTVAVHSE